MENQTDLEVILDFLEEYYRNNTGDGREHVGEPGEEHLRETCCEHWMHEGGTPDPQTMQSEYIISTLNQNTSALSERGSVPDSVSPLWQPATRHPGAAGPGKKLRLFHFLYEMLEDPDMAHCVWWVPAATTMGLFCFSSKNKDQVAALWGQRKGNRRPMTYQKMSRALRNYGRSGEILKVKKKLTYQFSTDTLSALRMMSHRQKRNL